MPLTANLFQLESSIIRRAKRAIDRSNEAGNSLNAVEHELVPTRVLNPNASEASYKPKQRSYRKKKLKKPAIVRRPVLAPYSPGTQMSSAQTANVVYKAFSNFCNIGSPAPLGDPERILHLPPQK